LYSQWDGKRVQVSSAQFDTLFNAGFLEVVGLLEEMGIQSTPKLSVGYGGRAQMGRLFQMTGAATLSVSVTTSNNNEWR